MKLMSTIALHSPLNISETIRLGSKGTPIGNDIWDHVTDDVT